MNYSELMDCTWIDFLCEYIIWLYVDVFRF